MVTWADSERADWMVLAIGNAASFGSAQTGVVGASPAARMYPGLGLSFALRRLCCFSSVFFLFCKIMTRTVGPVGGLVGGRRILLSC